MAYEIPYDSNYGSWYGTPQNVTRLSAVLEQTLDEEGNPIGVITASWDMPDNGGTFVAQLSTDGTSFYVAENGIRNNSVILEVSSNTDYYLKIITVLGVEQSSGSVSSLLSSSITEIPPTPIVSAVQGGMRINVGTIPFSYRVEISINDGTNTTVLYATEIITTYLCDAGTYTVSTAYVNASNDVGTSSSSASVTVSEMATADDFVEKTSADYIKSASVNASGDTLTLTQGNDVSITFQGGGGGGGGGSSYSETTLFEDSNGVNSGTINLDDDITNYELIAFYYSQNSIASYGRTEQVYTSAYFQYLKTNSFYLLCVMGYENRYIKAHFSDDSTIEIDSHDSLSAPLKINKIVGIKCGGGGGSPYTENVLFENADGVDSGTVNLNGNISYFDLFEIDVGGATVNKNSAIYTTSFVLASSNNASNTRIITTRYDTSYVTWAYNSDTSIVINAVGGSAKVYKIVGIKYGSSGGGSGGSYTAGDGIDITSNVISLETASANSIGGIKVGTNLSIDNNSVLSATDTTYSVFVGSGALASSGLVPAPPTTAGTSKYLREDGSWSTPSGGGGGGGSYTAGDGIDITNDVISLEVASANSIGGIKVGSGLSIDGNGVLSATGGGGSYTETVLFSNSSGVTSGSVPLNYNLSDYNMIQFTLIRTGSSNPKEIITQMATSGAVKNASRFCIYGFDNDYFDLIYASETSLTIYGYRNVALTEVLGIKF